MLLHRILTAVVLLALLVPALWSDLAWPFAGLTLLLIAAAGWEWARLTWGRSQAAHLVYGAACAVLAYALAGLLAPGTTVRFVFGVAVTWILFAPWFLRVGPAGWKTWPAVLKLMLGLAVLPVAWISLVQAKAMGLNFVMSVFCVVWVADIGGYFGGKTWGKTKLAPSISPGKTWEGAVTGAVGVLIMAAVWMWADGQTGASAPSFFSVLHAQFGGLVWPLLGLVVAMSVVGDLFESLLKRAVGAKDSSRLLPGHGGVLDRIDALLPVFPLAITLALW